MSTATPESMARALMARAAKEQAALAATECALRARLPELARLLRQRFGATQVILFGSLAWGRFHQRSDVDLAVAGLAAADLGPATALLEAVAQRTVELFRFEDLPASFRARVVDGGEVLL